MNNSELNCLNMLESIENSLTLLFSSRFFYREFVEIINANPELRKENHFLTWIVNNYLFSASVSLRRLLDKGRDTNSLIQLINTLKRNKNLLSRERYIQKFIEDSGFKEGDANYFFDKIADHGVAHFDIRKIEDKIKEIEDKWGRLKSYIDERIAHESRNLSSDLPTVSDLDECIDKLGEIAKSIIEVLMCKSILSFTPTIQYPWEEIFSFPWIKKT